MSKAYVYILKCADGKYYTGVTTNLDRRLTEHRTKKYKGYTSYRLPVELLFSKEFNTYHKAIQVGSGVSNSR